MQQVYKKLSFKFYLKNYNLIDNLLNDFKIPENSTAFEKDFN